MTITAMPLPTMAPVPRVRLEVTGVPAGAAMLTIWRISKSGEAPVRSAVEATATNPFQVVDYAVPWNEDVMYRVRFFTAAGSQVSFDQFAITRVVFFGTVMHQPLDPTRAVGVVDLSYSGKKVMRKHLGESVRPGAGLSVWVGQAASDFTTQLRMAVMSDADRERALSMFGTRVAPLPPIICLRTSLPLDLPQPFFFLAAETSWESVDHFVGGQMTELVWDATETDEPALGLLRSPYSYEDLEQSFDTYEDFEAEHATYEDAEARYDLSEMA